MITFNSISLNLIFVMKVFEKLWINLYLLLIHLMQIQKTIDKIINFKLS